MSTSSNGNSEPELSPLLSRRFVYKITAVVVLLAAITAALSLSGRWFGENLALAGHTSSLVPYDIFIGQDHLRLPANVIRFENQRATSIAERVDVYVTWPALEGYSDDNRNLFNDVSRPEALIFLQIAQSTMSRDMSGRLDPIYTQVFEGATGPGPNGLTRHGVKATSSYAGEAFFTAARGKEPPYVVRCLEPARERGLHECGLPARYSCRQGSRRPLPLLPQSAAAMARNRQCCGWLREKPSRALILSKWCDAGLCAAPLRYTGITSVQMRPNSGNQSFIINRLVTLCRYCLEERSFPEAASGQHP